MKPGNSLNKSLVPEKLDVLLGHLMVLHALKRSLNAKWAHYSIKFHGNARRVLLDPNDHRLRDPILEQAALRFKPQGPLPSWNNLLGSMSRLPEVFDPCYLESVTMTHLVTVFGEPEKRIYAGQGLIQDAAGHSIVGEDLDTLINTRHQELASTTESLSENSTVSDPTAIILSLATVASQNEATLSDSALQALAWAAHLDSEGIISILQDDIVQFYKRNRCDPLPVKLAGDRFWLNKREFSHMGNGGRLSLGLAVGRIISGVVGPDCPFSTEFITIAYTVLTSPTTKASITQSIGYTDNYTQDPDAPTVLDVFYYLCYEQNINKPGVLNKWNASTYLHAIQELLDKFRVIYDTGRTISISPPQATKGYSSSSLESSGSEVFASKPNSGATSDDAASTVDSSPALTVSSEVPSDPSLSSQYSDGNVSRQPSQHPVIASDWDLPGYEIDPEELTSEVGSDDREAVGAFGMSHVNQGYSSDKEGSPTQDFTLLTQSPISVVKGKLADSDDFAFLGHESSYTLSSGGSDQSMMSNVSAARSATCSRIHCSSANTTQTDGSFFHVSDAQYDSSGSSQSTDPGERLRMRLLMDLGLIKEGLSVYDNHYNHANKMAEARSTKDYMEEPHKCFKHFTNTKLEQMRRAIEFSSDSDGDTSGSQSSSLLSTDLLPACRDDTAADTSSKELKQDSKPTASNKSTN